MSSNHWTHQEKNQLQHLVVTVKQPIADIRVGRHNQSSIRRQATRLGYLTTRPAHIDWSRRQKQELRILNKAGYSCSQIINYNLLLNPPRSAWAIRNQWRRCKLSDRKVSRRQSQKKSWQPGEKLLFDEYLYQHSRTQTVPLRAHQVARRANHPALASVSNHRYRAPKRARLKTYSPASHATPLFTG